MISTDHGKLGSAERLSSRVTKFSQQMQPLGQQPTVGCWANTKILALPFVWRSTDGGASWVAQKSLGSASGWVQALDANTGWVSDAGYLWRTTDGGASWEGMGYGAPNRAHFRTLNEGWGVNGDRIVRTTDGGQTWVTVFTQPARQREWFLDHLTGWRSNGPIIERTTDGGGTWTDADTGLTGIDEYRFVDARNGWAWHHDSLGLAHTTDGGASWALQSPETDEFRYLQFVDVYRLGHGQHQSSRRTTDGGMSWHDVATPPIILSYGALPDIRELFFVDSHYGWAAMSNCGPHSFFVGSCDSYQTPTMDGGLTWEGPSGSGGSGMETDLGFVNRLDGWAFVANNDDRGQWHAEIRSTTDSGHIWTLRNEWSGSWYSSLFIDLHLSWLRVVAPDRLWLGAQVDRSSAPMGGPPGRRSGWSNSSRSRNHSTGPCKPSRATADIATRRSWRIALARPPVINASLEDWLGVPVFSLKEANVLVVEGTRPVPLDSSATLQAVWDDAHVYFAIRVYDDHITVDSPGVPWQDDAVEIGLDGADDHVRSWDLGSDSDDRVVTIDVHGNVYESGYPTTVISAAGAVTVDGYIVELAVPKAQLGPLCLSVWPPDRAQLRGHR